MNTEHQLIEQEEDTQHGRFLTFYLDQEVYGIEIRYITEIIGMQQITKVPEVADYIKGIINLRGKIIPGIDMRLKFSKPPAEYDDRTCTIIVDTQELIVGLIVDGVAEVLTIEDENIAPPPSHKSGIRNRYISGIGKVGNDVKLLIDCKKLFEGDEAQEIGDIE